MKRSLFALIIIALFGALSTRAQLSQCDTVVPFFPVDLTGEPDGTWESPSHYRKGNCCGTTSPDRCTSFEIILDSGAAMVQFEIASGAEPQGSMFYQIGCGPQVPVGEPICISGVGPHELTFCKPGNNENTYRITSIPQPIFPQDDSTRIGCTLPLEIYGLDTLTITSVYPGAPGDYDSYMSCKYCSTPIFEPGLGSPPYIDYEVCGTPIATECGYVYTCDTFRIYVFDELVGSVNPDPASFCIGGPGVTLTASATGGAEPYYFQWFDSASDSLSSDSTYVADSVGNYTVEIKDVLVSPTCPAEYITVPVTTGYLPDGDDGDAGNDTTVCANDPIAYLQGTADDPGEDGAVWGGGAGTFTPNDSTLFASYYPTPAEIDAGFVTLYLTAYEDEPDGCPDDVDSVTIYFSDTVDVTFTVPTLLCNGDSGTVTANVSNGTPPYYYLWSTGATNPSITAGAGTYWVDITDSIGCTHREWVTISQPPPLTLSLTSTDVSVDGGSDGTATATVGGGTPGYSYLWSNGDMTDTARSLSYGIVTVTVTDTNGCTISGSVVVNEPRCSSFSSSATSTDVSCFGSDDGTASASASGGTAPYSYSWNTAPPTAGPNVSGLQAGTYTVTVTDAGGCVDLSTVNIFEPAQLVNTMSHTNVSSIGGSDGSATANPSGGTPGYTYLWSPGGELTQTITSLSAGTYFVDIEDANNCVIQDSVVINEPPCDDFEIGVVQTNISCAGESDGSAYVVIAHGTEPYTINWSDGQTGMSATELAAGSYTVTVTDSTGCTTFETFTITEPSPLSIGLAATNVSCYEAKDGTIDLSISGGTYPYSFEWSNGNGVISHAEDLVYLEPGTYSVEVTDDNGCMAVGSIGISEPDRLEASANKVNATCAGYTDGSIDATISGGTSPFTYSWAGPNMYSASTQDISNLGAGLYTLSVTDANGCQLSPKLEVYINDPDTVEIITVDVECPEPGDDSAWVTVDSIIGGAETLYFVSFDSGSTYLGLGVYSALLPTDSTYYLMAQDTNGCETGEAFPVTVDPTLVIDSVVFDPCIPPAATDIPVTVWVSGGDGGPYEVSSDGGSGFNAPGTLTINLPIDSTYDIVVRDGKGCLSEEWTIVIPDELIATATESVQVSCLGENDGEIDLTVTGGVPPYSYSWTGPMGFTSFVEDPTGLIEGKYYVTVTDDSLCTAVDSVTITTVPDVTLPTITCPGDITVANDSGICGAVVNYTPPVGTDNCPLGTNTALTAGLPTGSVFPVGTTVVTYTVTDSAGNSASCSFDVTVNDNEDPIITCPADVAVNTDPGVCGTDSANVSLGSPVTSDNCGVASVTNNAPSLFPVGMTIVTWTVTDLYGNTATCTQNVAVTDNEQPSITCPPTANINTDPGACQATSVSLGTPTTSDNCGVASVTNDAPSSFPVGTTVVTWTVTDSNGNSATCTQDVVITDNEDPTLTFCPSNISTCDTVITYNPPTATDNCGVATITQVGGLGSGQTFPVGTTTEIWEITDVNGNVTICQFDVTVHPTPEIDLVPTNVSCKGAADGSIDATITSGTAPFSYNWSNGATIEDISTLSAGTYTLQVTDINGCMNEASAIITEPDSLLATETHQDASCFGEADGSIFVTPTGGTPPYFYNWSTGETTQGITGLAAGTYTATVIDVNGCSYNLSIDIEEPDSISVTATATNATCLSADGGLDITPVGGTPPYQYQWSNGDNTQDLQGVQSGAYTVIITDANGCNQAYSDSIESVNPLIVNGNIDDPICHGDANGSIDLIIRNGTAPYSYDWNTGDTTGTVTGLPAGTYTVTVTDSNQCQATVDYEIIDPDTLILDLFSPEYANGHNVSTYLGDDGEIDLTVTGGVPPYDVLWSNGSTSEDQFNLEAGFYSVVVTDANGCAHSDTIRLTQPFKLAMPTGYSPNGDGYNDNFEVLGIEGYPDNEIFVYNRWGNLVYNEENYMNEWNGQNMDGEALPDATYFVILKIEDPDVDDLTGYVDLRRTR